MILPVGASSFKDAMKMGVEVYHHLKVLKQTYVPFLLILFVLCVWYMEIIIHFLWVPLFQKFCLVFAMILDMESRSCMDSSIINPSCFVEDFVQLVAFINFSKLFRDFLSSLVLNFLF